MHLHGRHPNAFTARLLPEDRWIAFWYVAQRLARTYVVNPYEGDSLAVFIDRDERFAAWEPLLGRRGDIRIVGASHGALVAEPALSEWMAILTERLRSEAG